MEGFTLSSPLSKPVPIVISSPHSGTDLPPDVEATMNQNVVAKKDDTDWYVDRLYDFAPSLGITQISARYSRYLIDLNRHPESRSLYGDGRAITELVPSRTFLGEDIYQKEPPSAQEITRRKDKYYTPYYAKVQAIIDELRQTFDHVLFFDAHSIQGGLEGFPPFSDLTLGSNDSQSARSDLEELASEHLSSGPFSFSNNHPFKGGHLTRYFGRPENGVSALQLEMCKHCYMNDQTGEYPSPQTEPTRALLISLFEKLIEKLENR